MAQHVVSSILQINLSNPMHQRILIAQGNALAKSLMLAVIECIVKAASALLSNINLIALCKATP